MVVTDVAISLNRRGHGTVQLVATDFIRLHGVGRRAVDTLPTSHWPVAVVSHSIPHLPRFETVDHVAGILTGLEGEVMAIEFVDGSCSVRLAEQLAGAELEVPLAVRHV